MNLPYNIEKILNVKIVNDENIVTENNNFIVLEDKKHTNESYHYTAWIKKDIKKFNRN